MVPPIKPSLGRAYHVFQLGIGRVLPQRAHDLAEFVGGDGTCSTTPRSEVRHGVDGTLGTDGDDVDEARERSARLWFPLHATRLTVLGQWSRDLPLESLSYQKESMILYGTSHMAKG